MGTIKLLISMVKSASPVAVGTSGPVEQKYGQVNAKSELEASQPIAGNGTQAGQAAIPGSVWVVAPPPGV